MKHLLTITILLIITNIISACSGASSKNMRTYMIDSKNEGMLVGTISFEDRTGIPPRRTFFYEAQNLPFIQSEQSLDSLSKIGHLTDYFDKVVIKAEKGDFTEDGKWIYYFTIVKPEGKYKFYQLQVFLNTGHMQSTRSYPIDIPFEIQKGEINYFGEIKYNISRGTIEILNKIDRDRIKFKEKFPHINF